MEIGNTKIPDVQSLRQILATTCTNQQQDTQQLQEQCALAGRQLQYVKILQFR